MLYTNTKRELTWETVTLQVHLYGTSLGGFLAQLFAQYRPRRVKSLLLSNTFVDNWAFEATMPWASL